VPSDGPLIPQNYRDREVLLNRPAIIYLRGSRSEWGEEKAQSLDCLREAGEVKVSKRGSERLFEKIELTKPISFSVRPQKKPIRHSIF
jgi:hypothetical protein